MAGNGCPYGDKRRIRAEAQHAARGMIGIDIDRLGKFTVRARLRQSPQWFARFPKSENPSSSNGASSQLLQRAGGSATAVYAIAGSYFF